MKNVQQIWAKEIEPYGQFERVVIYYAKNGRDQRAVYMNYGDKNTPNYKIIEDNAISKGNRLNTEEQKVIGDMINKENLIIVREK